MLYRGAVWRWHPTVETCNHCKWTASTIKCCVWHYQHNICISPEVIVLKQYTPKKHERFSIKIYKLYWLHWLHDMKVYLGKDKQDKAQDLTTTPILPVCVSCLHIWLLCSSNESSIIYESGKSTLHNSSSVYFPVWAYRPSSSFTVLALLVACFPASPLESLVVATRCLWWLNQGV
jgi:hypothetical protein